MSGFIQPFPVVSMPAGLEAENIKDGVKIGNVTGTFTRDADAVAEDVLEGKTVYVKGVKVTGTIKSKEAQEYTAGTADQTIPAGMYTAGVQTIKGDDNLAPENIKANVDIFNTHGTFTEDATATDKDILQGVTAYVNGAKITGAIQRQAGSTITPAVRDVTANVKEKYMEDNIIVKGDANLISENIKKGVNIFNVAGSLDADGVNTSDATAVAADILSGKTAYAQNKKLTGTIAVKEGQRFTPTKGGTTLPEGYYSGETGKENAIKGDANFSAENIKKGVEIWNVEGTYAGETPEGLTPENIKAGVEIAGVTGTFTNDADALPTEILNGRTAYVQGHKVTGTIASKAAETFTPGTTDQTIANGQYLVGDQTIKGDANLVAENIKQGVSIFGVAGTASGGQTAADSHNYSSSNTTIPQSFTCGFRPTKILIVGQRSTGGYCAYYDNGTLNNAINSSAIAIITGITPTDNGFTVSYSETSAQTVRSWAWFAAE